MRIYRQEESYSPLPESDKRQRHERWRAAVAAAKQVALATTSRATVLLPTARSEEEEEGAAAPQDPSPRTALGQRRGVSSSNLSTTNQEQVKRGRHLLLPLRRWLLRRRLLGRRLPLGL